MAETASGLSAASAQPARGFRSALTEARPVRIVLIALTVLILAVFLVLPLIIIFVQALDLGLGQALATFQDPDAISAILLTLLVAVIAVPCNLIFGIAAAWAIAKFRFRGRAFLISLIDLPFSVSPVVAGLVYILLLGPFTPVGAWLLEDFGVRIIFAVPGVVLATIFVTFPFIARELIPLMQEQGTGDEEAALSLGASGWQTFFFVTLPNVKWALLYGVLLCNARAMGEFGAVSVISGRLRGETVTMPLQIELYYQEFRALAQVSAFSMAAVLAGLALVTLVIKTWFEWRYADQLAAAGKGH
ncbi:MAG: sulfate ABC transporter permease subunit CysW [Rhodospirillaceae bacterium]|nr:sulfate ABC transporter permease subunit CysW [Rhodospirillaceae bacterium]